MTITHPSPQEVHAATVRAVGEDAVDFVVTHGVAKVVVEGRYNQRKMYGAIWRAAQRRGVKIAANSLIDGLIVRSL